MSNTYGLALATLDPSLCILLLMYGMFLGINVVAGVFSYGIRHSLPRNFLISGLVTVITQAIVRGIAIYFLIYISYDCVMGRKLMYAVNYIGFLSYDYYQIKKVIERTRPKNYEIGIFAALFLGRMATLIYCVYFMSGVIVNPVTTGLYIGAGSCNSKVTRTMVYVEHLYNIGMESLIIFRVFLFATSLNSKKASWEKIILYVFDFEMFTFVYYLCFEIAYMIMYEVLPASDISFVNAVYVFLFLANATHYTQDKFKKAVKLGLKVEKKRIQNDQVNASNKSTQVVKRTE
ncbi:hypothetical protein HDV04_002875 [Boothiomyces sp. JEL0838]|nr:hypothetical protein HDV04_002875 [Boothiomyces sp. JEL0838]